MEPEELNKNEWFQMLGAVIAATEDEADTCRANMTRSTVTRHCDYLLVEVVSRPTIIDEFPSAPHKLVQPVHREEKDMKMPVQQEPKQLPRESGGKTRVSRLQERRGKCVFVAVVHNAKSEKNEGEETMLGEKQTKNKKNVQK